MLVRQTSSDKFFVSSTGDRFTYYRHDWARLSIFLVPIPLLLGRIELKSRSRFPHRKCVEFKFPRSNRMTIFNDKLSPSIYGPVNIAAKIFL